MKTVRNRQFVFHCDTEIEQWRAETMFTKEPGTIAWLDANVQPGDVFWDVGANIGVYSLYAAKLGAQVYAFEPHVGNATNLLRNIAANKLADKITLLTIALDRRDALVPFYYMSKMSGASGSQLHQPLGEDGNEFVPAATEMKWAMQGDSLPLPNPVLLKIDTDGNEPAIIHGLSHQLRCAIRSAQVEVHPAHLKTVDEMLVSQGLALNHRHYTSAGQKRIDEGADPLTVVHNAVYRRV